MKQILYLLSVVVMIMGAINIVHSQNPLPSNSYLAILLDNNVIALVRSDSTEQGVLFGVTGITGILRGIDTRPANGQLYGVTTAGVFYMIDTVNLNATRVSTQDIKFSGGGDFGFDFNPTVDRIRMLGVNGRNARYNIDTGALADFDNTTAGSQSDLPLKYASGSGSPQVVGAAYTNSRSNGPAVNTTQLFDIDRNGYNLVLQNPPNNGSLTVVGRLGISGFRRAGFDILTDSSSNNYAILATNRGFFYSVNLTTGAASRVWAESHLLSLLRPRGLAILLF